jgi:GH15 family glucan-1,4-alpha-glucosidase
VALRIEDYALIGDTHTAALVGRDGSIDWLCLPRFDSGACFAALLGTPEHGRWLLAPAEPDAPQAQDEPVTSQTWRYQPGTLVLEHDFETAGGAVRIIDFMPPRETTPDIVRLVVGLRGEVRMRMELIIRFDYGFSIPWVRRDDHMLRAIAGPDALVLRTPVETVGKAMTTVADFTVREGERVPFVLTWFPSHEHTPRAVDPEQALQDTLGYWAGWGGAVSGIEGPWRDAVHRSLITLKALTYAPTGGIVAAATTSLPEDLGGVRNWDYRYCWVRDATLTLDALMQCGCSEEAVAWRQWLLRAAAGAPEQLQIMYGPAGERRLPEFELDHLPGYQGSRPVRIGNAAAGQFQLDVYGELMDAMDRARHHGINESKWSWALQQTVMDYVEEHWSDPDDGIWEVRGPRRHFVHSRVMAWVAADRAVKGVEQYGLKGPLDRWRKLRRAIHLDVTENGFNQTKGAFTQFYGSDALDASVLLIPLVGFLPASDPRVKSTVEAIERELVVDGFVRRYQNEVGVDGLPGDEGAFLACSFWLAEDLALIGRVDDACALFERLLGVANDLGLLSEEYDPMAKRLVGNYPQAFSQVGLINTARHLARILSREHASGTSA